MDVLHIDDDANDASMVEKSTSQSEVRPTRPINASKKIFSKYISNSVTQIIHQLALQKLEKSRCSNKHIVADVLVTHVKPFDHPDKISSSKYFSQAFPPPSFKT